jgi:sarcosine oxidase subunit alpha
MRVDGVPSVRTCRLPAEHDLHLETQNVLGSAEIDLLSATDWFFPGGMNHHDMFTWAKPVNQMMQLVAREVAGIGTLPSEIASASPVIERSIDVLVVGAGLAGLAAARVLARAGRSVLVVDEEETLGGPPRLGGDHGDVVTSIAREAEAAGAELRTGHSAIGLFDEPPEGRLALITSSSGLTRVTARAWLLAVGRSEGSSAFEGADLPGVIGAEAAARLFARGIVPGERIVIAGDRATREAELTTLAATLTRHGAKVEGPHALDRVVRADGRNHVSSVTLREGEARTKHACDLLVVGPRTSASYELAVQAGAKTTLREGSFELVHPPGAHATWIVGSARDLALAHAAPGVQHHRMLCEMHRYGVSAQALHQVAVFEAGKREALVKAADGFEGSTAHQQIARPEKSARGVDRCVVIAIGPFTHRMDRAFEHVDSRLGSDASGVRRQQVGR